MPSLPAAGEARFITGNIMYHVVVMAGTGAIGLIAIFAVDLLNLFYISLLGQHVAAMKCRRGWKCTSGYLCMLLWVVSFVLASTT